MNWSKSGRYFVADWQRGTAQIVRDEIDPNKPFKFAVFEVGAIIAQGREPTMARAKTEVEKAIPRS
jgi:hypothetical protein